MTTGLCVLASWPWRVPLSSDAMETQGGKVRARQQREMKKTASNPGKPQTASPMSVAGTLPHVCCRPIPPCLQQVPPPCLPQASTHPPHVSSRHLVPSLMTVGIPHTMSVAGTLPHVCSKPGQWCRVAGKQFRSRWLCSRVLRKEGSSTERQKVRVRGQRKQYPWT